MNKRPSLSLRSLPDEAEHATPVSVEEFIRGPASEARRVNVPTDIDIHPAANLFPMMTEEEAAEMERDLEQKGLLHPLVFYQGQLLEGRNRYVILRRLGLPIETREWAGEGGSPTAYALSANRPWRRLTPAQLATIAAEAVPLFEEEARRRIIEGGRKGGGKPGDGSSPGLPRDESGRSVVRAARATGAGIGSTKTMKQVRDVAPEVVPLARHGRVNVSEAKELAARPKEERGPLLEKIQGGARVKEVLYKPERERRIMVKGAAAGALDWRRLGAAWMKKNFRRPPGTRLSLGKEKLSRVLETGCADLLEAARWGADQAGGDGAAVRTRALELLVQGAARG